MSYLNAMRSRLGLLAAGAVMALANIAPASADHRMSLPVGTVIPVKLNQALGSKESQPGDRFTATVKEGRDDAGLPYGTRVEGVIREAMPSSEGKPGVLDVEFRRIVFPDNESRTIEGTLYSLNGKDVQRRDGRLVATADKGKDRLKWIGIGAGAGAILGTLTKGNVLLDTLLGAGAGYLYNELQGKKAGDVKLKEGTEFGVRLDKAVDFTMDDRSYYRYRERVDDDRYFDDESFRNDKDKNRTDRNRDDRYRDDRNRDDRYRDDRYYRDRNGDRYYQDNYANRGGNSTDIGMVIDRREVKFSSSAKPFMRNDVVFVPLEAVSKSADLGYRYDSSDKLIRSRNGDVRLYVGSRVAMVNGERRILPAPAEMRSGMVYVPMQFVGWLTGGSVSYDSFSKTVIVTSDRDIRD
jgi:hypothetical protein